MLKTVFFIILGLLVIADFFVPKHPHYGWERLPGGYAIYAFLSCVVIVVVSKVLGRLWLKKKEDYYE
ncbi:MAG: hypothetical protein ACE5EB_07010 [Thermodesulfobacteriota bacterium]